MTPTLERADMRYWRMQPNERLHPWVICYFLVEPTGPTPQGKHVVAECQEQLLLPDGYSEIVFKLDAAFERWALGQQDERTVMSSSYLIGGRSHSVLTRNLGAVRLAGAVPFVTRRPHGRRTVATDSSQPPFVNSGNSWAPRQLPGWQVTATR